MESIFLQTFVPSFKYNITLELVPYVEIPDYIPEVDMLIEIAKDDYGNYCFGDNIKNGLFIHTTSDNVQSEVKVHLSIDKWTQLHLSKPIPKNK